MKIYVVEQYHDNDIGIFTTLDAAVKCATAVNSGADGITEMELSGEEFLETLIFSNDGTLV